MPKTPKVPTIPERQAVKLPDAGSPISKDASMRRRAIMAGIMTSPQGVLGNPNVSKPTLG